MTGFWSLEVPYLDVFTTLPEALGQHRHHVLVVVQQLLHQLTEAGLHLLVLDLFRGTHQPLVQPMLAHVGICCGPGMNEHVLN